MEIRISLNDNADIPFIKKLLSQIKGIGTVEFLKNNEDETYSWEEIENSEAFGKVMEQSRNQIKNGDYVEHSQELMDSLLNRK